ncbi:aldehyde dehydrogenase (NAD(P)(+)) ald5 [Umbelopsis nana]
MTASGFITEFTTDRGYALKLQTGLFINNEFVAGDSKIDTINPANGKVIASVEAAGKEQVDAAVDAAEKAYDEVWSKVTPQKRRDLMLKLASLIDRDFEELAQIESLDNGKGISLARGFDVRELAECIRYYAGWTDKVHGKVIETEGVLSYTRHEPIGVCGAIIPWNFPLLMFAWKIAPALATGNVVVIKTSELTPLSALKVASLAKEAGFPPGVLNVITGYGHITGDLLARHKKLGKIAFTGSTNVGRLVMKAAAESNLKKVTLELGGKSPNIIFDDADLDLAIKWSFRGVFFNHGQTCCAGTRIYVQEGIYDKFIEKFKAHTSQTPIGHPQDDTTFQGPQVSQTQYDRIMGYIDSGKKEGATVTLGGNRWGTEGYYVEPTIFTDVREDMTIMKEEIFGPVVCVSKFKDEEEAVKLANNTNYGLASAIFSESNRRCIEVAKRIKAGTVWVNCVNVLHANTPFGGYKESGIGRENGEYALDNYTQVKVIKMATTMQP